MSELGELASGAAWRRLRQPKTNMIASVNAGIRMLSLSAMALHARLQTNPLRRERSRYYERHWRIVWSDLRAHAESELVIFASLPR